MTSAGVWVPKVSYLSSTPHTLVPYLQSTLKLFTVLFQFPFHLFQNYIIPFSSKKKSCLKIQKSISMLLFCFFVVVSMYSCGLSHNIIYSFSQWDSTFWQPLQNNHDPMKEILQWTEDMILLQDISWSWGWEIGCPELIHTERRIWIFSGYLIQATNDQWTWKTKVWGKHWRRIKDYAWWPRSLSTMGTWKSQWHSKQHPTTICLRHREPRAVTCLYLDEVLK